MVERLGGDPWLYRAIFVLMALALFFLRLLPLGPDSGTWGWLDILLSENSTEMLLRLTTGSEEGSWPGPDLLLCLILVWVMRRPDYLPAGLIAGVVLVEDMLLMRPPGLWAALVVIAAEFLRSRVALTRELNFTVEWLLASALIVGLLVAWRMALAVVLLPQPAFGFALMQTVGTILCYPVVVAFSRIALDVHKPATGEVDAKGRRL
jgi:rod shape-determining protein MreD